MGYKGRRIIGVSEFRQKRRTRPFSVNEECAQLIIIVIRRPRRFAPSVTTSPGFLPALCEKWSGLFYMYWVLLSFTRDRQLNVSSERLGNEDTAPCPRRALLPGQGSIPGPLGMESVRGLNRSGTTTPLTLNWFIDESIYGEKTPDPPPPPPPPTHTHTHTHTHTQIGTKGFSTVFGNIRY